MKSNSRPNVLLAILMVLAVAAFFLLRTTNEKVIVKSTEPAQKPILPAPFGSNAPAANRMVDPIVEKVEAEREINLQKFFNTSINFFGKVVDENNQPISGASTFYSVATASFEGSPTLEGPSTDAAGLFSITQKRGPDLSVRVEHLGYYQTQSSDQKIEYARREYMPGKGPPPPPTKNNPTIFVLKKKGVAEQLLHHSGIRTRLPFGGNPVTINLRTGKTELGSETIVISLQSAGDKLPPNTFKPFDWSVTIQVPGGGLVERQDALDFQAPASGYAAQTEVKMPASLPRSDWKSWVQKDCFVSLGSGNYARVRLNISGDKGRCIAEVFLNPMPGSRNLEFDPNAKAQ